MIDPRTAGAAVLIGICRPNCAFSFGLKVLQEIEPGGRVAVHTPDKVVLGVVISHVVVNVIPPLIDEWE